MKWTAKWAPWVFILVLMISCEEVIELDLGNAEPRIVIEGLVTTHRGPYSVKIRQSIDYQDTNIFPPVSGAKVTITDEEGYSEILKEVADGIYETAELKGEDGKTYLLEVVYEGEVYSASSTIPETMIPISSINYKFLKESLFNEEGFYMAAFFYDPVNEVNYYRLKVFVNGEPYFFAFDGKRIKDDNFWLINDKFFNGQLMDYGFPHKLQLGDKVDIELHQVDKGTYEYYRTLVEVMGIGEVAPSNPITNWDNGALGYFGAVSITDASIDIEEK
ncbi:MAG: DUF4249 domain-containing protein [Anditalea sp.]